MVCENHQFFNIFVPDKSIIMNRFCKTMLSLIVLFGIAHVAIADKGAGRKNKAKVVLNISTPTTLTNSISFNLKSGLTYKGSLLVNQQTVGSLLMSSSIITYQKGNTIYIIPYKHQFIMPDVQQGYTGIKFVFQPK
jgi:hypothetical protein